MMAQHALLDAVVFYKDLLMGMGQFVLVRESVLTDWKGDRHAAGGQRRSAINISIKRLRFSSPQPD